MQKVNDAMGEPPGSPLQFRGACHSSRVGLVSHRREQLFSTNHRVPTLIQSNEGALTPKHFSAVHTPRPKYQKGRYQ